MHVTVVHDPLLSESILSAWQSWTEDRPMQSPTWAMNWWASYGAGSSAARQDRLLCLVIATDEQGTVRGILPLYRELTTVIPGLSEQALRWIGDGTASSDHLTLLCETGDEASVAKAMAAWLLDAECPIRWNMLQLEGTDDDDLRAGLFFTQLQNAGCWVDQRPDQSTWAMELPGTWEEYLAGLSKNHRKRCRRWWNRYFETQRVKRHEVTSLSDLPGALEILYRLHDSRRSAIGDGGVFEGEFRDFHERLIAAYLPEGRASVNWIELDGEPIAAEYQLLTANDVWCYQSGMSVEHADHSPGSLSILASIRWAIEHGYRRLDLLRGDESYKQHWGATSRGVSRRMIRPGRWDAGLLHTVQRAGHHAKRWINFEGIIVGKA